MFEMGELVRINFEKIDGQNNELRIDNESGDYEEGINKITDWSIGFNRIHTVTDKKMGKSTYGIMCYELDNQYWFDEYELIEKR